MMYRVRRIDRAACVLDFAARTPTPAHAAARYTDEGYLIVDAYLARDGLLRYSDGLRSWMEYRPASELEAAVDTFRHKPVTDGHPPVMVSAANASKYTRGVTLDDVRTEVVDGVTYLRGTIKILDERLIQKIADGQLEISIGMWSRVEVRDGEYNGQPYKAVQTDCTGNHVASVPKGRAGAAVRVFMDGADVAVHTEGEIMFGVKIDKALIDAMAARFDEIGAPTAEAKLIGPDGAEIMVPTWLAAFVEEYKAMKAAEAEGAAEEPPPEEPAADAPAEEPPPEEPAEDAPGETSPPPGEPPNPDEDKQKRDEMTQDEINKQVRRRVRLERLAEKAGLDMDAVQIADETTLSREIVAKIMPAHKARVDTADGDVLDALVEVAATELASRPKPESANPFERRRKIADANEDPIREAGANALAKALGLGA